jgi:hypothetical protein
MQMHKSIIFLAIISLTVSCVPVYQTDFNDQTDPDSAMKFTVQERDNTTFTLYDFNTNLVYQSYSQVFDPDKYTFKLDTRRVPISGVYFVRYKLGQQVRVKRIFLLSTNIPEEYRNPDLKFPSRYLKELDFGEPYPRKEYPNPYNDRVTVRQFNLFIESIKQEFKTSNCTNLEASTLINLLKNYITISDGSYGMPSPDDPPQEVQNLSERVLIKKINDNLYHIFYYKFGCGRTYFYQEVIPKNRTLKLNSIEIWREFYSC